MKKIIATAALAVVAFSGAAEARDQVQVAGSSTVLPYAQIVAEQFGKTYAGTINAPIVESGGSSAGLKLFCSGVGTEYIDVANASRKIKDKEVKACAENGVTDIIEVPFGKDGVVMATKVGMPEFAFTPKDVFLALAAQVPVDGKLVDNPYKTWDQVNSSFPKQEITMYIPGEKHGTREVFEVKVLEEGCAATGAEELFKAAGDKKAKGCIKVRTDGASVDIDGDYSETIARVESNPAGVGVFGISFYENNRDKLNVATVDGVVPSLETIQNGEYPVSRHLYFYVKAAHIGVVPGIDEYVNFFLSDRMVGEDGMVVEKGLIPLSETALKELRASVAAHKTM